MADKRYLVEFHVSPDSLTWLVKHAGTVLSRHTRKREAVRAAAGAARAGAPSVLVVERMDGTLEAERRYGAPRRE